MTAIADATEQAVQRAFATEEHSSASNQMALPAYQSIEVYYPTALIGKNLISGYVGPLGAQGTGDIYTGYCLQKKTTAATNTDRIAINTEGVVLKGVTVAGASAVTDNGAFVYSTTDNHQDDLTLTRAATDSMAIGRVERWISGTTCWVKTFSADESHHFNTNGGGRRVLNLLEAYSMDGLISSTKTAIMSSFPMTGSGKLVTLFSKCTTVTTDSSANSSFTVDINTTACTGTLSLVNGDAIGLISTQALTGSVTYQDGDTLTLKGAYDTNDYSDGANSFGVIIEASV